MSCFGATADVNHGVWPFIALRAVRDVDALDSAAGPGVASRLVQSAAHGRIGSSLLVVALLGLVCGLGFKIAAVPMHFWCPDVFEGAGIDVAAFLSVASKGAGLVLLLRFAAIAAAAGYHATGLTSTLAVVGSSALTCTVRQHGASSRTTSNVAALTVRSPTQVTSCAACRCRCAIRPGRGGAPGDLAAERNAALSRGLPFHEPRPRR